jgi:hypothetical protein
MRERTGGGRQHNNERERETGKRDGREKEERVRENNKGA